MKQIVEFTISCKECNVLVANSNNVLARHLRKVHQLEYDLYVVKHEYNDIWPVCKCGCNTKLKWHKGGFPTFASKSCASKKENNGMYGRKGKDSPNTGKVRTEAHKKNYSRAATIRWAGPVGDVVRAIIASDEYKAKQRAAQLHVYQTTDRLQKTRESVIRFWNESPLADEARKKIREASFRSLENGKKLGDMFKTEWKMNPFTGKEEYMHSSWETRFLDECVNDNIPVTKVHKIRIPYRYKKRKHEYMPDFVCEELSIVFEIKGWKTDIDVAKWKAAKRWCLRNGYVFVVYDRKHFIKKSERPLIETSNEIYCTK